VLLAYNTQGTPLFYPVTIHNFGLYLTEMDPTLRGRKYHRTECLDRTAQRFSSIAIIT